MNEMKTEGALRESAFDPIVAAHPVGLGSIPPCVADIRRAFKTRTTERAAESSESSVRSDGLIWIVMMGLGIAVIVAAGLYWDSPNANRIARRFQPVQLQSSADTLSSDGTRSGISTEKNKGFDSGVAELP